MQCTLRKILNSASAALRMRAREQAGANEVAIEVLVRDVELRGELRRQRDLSDIAGTWRADRIFDQAIAAQDSIDTESWR